METIGQTIVKVLNKTFAGYIKSVSEKYKIPVDELNNLMLEILPTYKVTAFFSKKTTQKKCKNEKCEEMCIKGSRYCQEHKGGGRKKKSSEIPPLELEDVEEPQEPQEEEPEEEKPVKAKTPPPPEPVKPREKPQPQPQQKEKHAISKLKKTALKLPKTAIPDDDDDDVL